MSEVDESQAVSWQVARRVAEQALRRSSVLDEETRASLEEDFATLSVQAEQLVEVATGLVPPDSSPNAVVTDRLGWVDANLGSFRRLLDPVAERLAKRRGRSGSGLGELSAAAAGAEIGLVLAWMSSRVLGQYDLLPHDSGELGDAIYFVGPNIAALERRYAFPPREFRLWIAIHEVTHRVQFTAVPWMRPYFLSLLERGSAISPPDAAMLLSSLKRAVEEIRQGRNPLEDGGIVTLLATSEQLGTLHEAQALMSLLEGHGDVVMSSAAVSQIPGAARFARVLSDRRHSTKGLAKLLQQAIGIEAKLRQYEEGERFVEAVLATGGAELLARVWDGPEQLPTMEEIRAPQRWIDRSTVGQPAR